MIGGLGSLGGAVLGAVYLRGTRWFIPSQEWQQLSTGAGVLLVLLILPGGLGALWITIRDMGVRLLTRPSRAIGTQAPRTGAAGRCRASRADGVMHKFLAGCRHPGIWLRDICGGESAFPLVVLFGLNAVDELDRTAFGILLPNIRDEFHLDNTKVLGLVALVSVAALALQVPIAQYADRSRRVPLVVMGAVMWAMFSGMTGLATGVIMLTIARSGSAVGKAVIDPTHNSLLADYYPINSRSRVFSTHRAANAVGSFIGPLSAGLLAYAFGWRTPFLVFVIPTMIFAVIALRLREPVRGRWERQAMGASDDVIATEETVPSYAESWRTVQKIESLKRIWWSLPFLATALIGFVALASLLYEQEFGLDDRARGIAAAIAEPFALVGLVWGSRIVTRRYMADMRGLIRFLSKVAVATSLVSLGFVVAPNIIVAVSVQLRDLGVAGDAWAPASWSRCRWRSRRGHGPPDSPWRRCG